MVWNLYFGNESVAKKTVDHILSYMRSSPTWAYNGGSRSWGDVENNGKYLATFGTGSSDRGQMHYRSGLNMIPLIEWYRLHPEEGLTLLEISMGAIAGQMANIDPATGATSMMFHAAPHMLSFDPHSGDYGLGFFGNALESGSYYVEDAELGSLCFLCTLDTGEAGATALTPADAYRVTAFLQPLGLYIQVQCGTLASLTLRDAEALRAPRKGEGPPISQPMGSSNGQLDITFEADAPCAALRIQLTKTAAAMPGTGFSVVGAPLVRGAYEVQPAVKGQQTVAHVEYTLRDGPGGNKNQREAVSESV